MNHSWRVLKGSLQNEFSLKRRPKAAIGSALSQAPDSGHAIAKRRALD